VATVVPREEDRLKTEAFQAFYEDLVRAIWHDLQPLVEEIENTEQIPHDTVWTRLRDMGALGLLIPEEYGGSGLTVTQYVPVIAEISKVHGGIRALVHVHNSMCHALWELASEEQRADVLRRSVRGEASVAFALTEPEHGTGRDIGTLARRTKSGYSISGRKWLITNSNFASDFIVFAKIADGLPSAFLVSREARGLTIEAMPETMGCKGGQHGQLTFDDVVVDASALLGEEGEGIAKMEQALEISRVFVAASSLGTAERALELSVAHARQRVTFGQPIASRQAVQRYLAEMAVDIYALSEMLRDAAAKWDAGRRIPGEAAMCKLFGLEAVGRVTDRALLVHGGIGYTRAHEIERLYRDARLNWLEEGTPTIQQMVIARELLGGDTIAGALGIDV
jgi:alkylation response protein AidB-like acyl-CoA dehydrogenase